MLPIYFRSKRQHANVYAFGLNPFKVFLIAILPLMYIWSLLFDYSSTAIAYSSLANTLLAMGTFVAVLVLRQIEKNEPEVNLEDRKSWIMGNIFTIFPQFNFAFGMFELYVNSNLIKTCGIDEQTKEYCRSMNLTYTEEGF